MRSEVRSPGPTFLGQARHAQLVDCAIQVLAAEGYAKASLTRIAERAGISKSVVVYHFGTKEHLFEAVVASVFEEATSVVRAALEGAPSASSELAGYLRARITFLGARRDAMLALYEIWMNLRNPDGSLRLTELDAAPTVAGIERILRRGQASGEFGAFSVPITAMVVRQAVDGVLLQARITPDLDLEQCAEELVRLFARATGSRS